MKKNLIVALALVFVLGIAGTAFAAANPFVDVPAKHWAYDAVTKLAQAGILDGYGDGTYRGERLATRYELAQATAKAMARADKADAQMKALIDKLAVEFAAELNNLGVRVAKLEKNASSIKFSGDARIRFQRVSDASNGSYWNERVRLNLASDLNDKVAFQGRLVIQNVQYATATTGAQNDQLEYDQANFTFKGIAPNFDFTLGRTGADLLNALFYSYNYWDAAKVTYKNGKFAALAGYGDARFNPGPNRTDASNISVAPFAFWAAGANYQASKELNISAAYLSANETPEQTAKFNTWGLGLKYQITDWLFLAEYAKNTKDLGPDTNNDAMVFQLNYKMADRNKPNTWQVYAQWFKVGNGMTDIAKLNGAYFQYPADSSGWAYGVKYTVSKNVVAGLEIQSLKTYGGSDKLADANNAFQFRTDFWF